MARWYRFLYKNWTEKKKKFDWQNRMRLTKAFVPFLQEGIDKWKEKYGKFIDVTLEIKDNPPRIMIRAVHYPDGNAFHAHEFQDLIDAFCKKWDYVWKVWQIGDHQPNIHTYYQLTYTFEEYKEPKYEPYTG